MLSQRPAGDSHTKLFVVLAALMLLLAFGFQFTSTAGVTVPVEEDFYRDLGAANALLNGLSSDDPNLAGEVRWYNPMVPWLVSVASRVSAVAAFDLYAHIGVFLNLLAPIALCVFVARLWSWPAACFALMAYLFLGQHQELSTRYATYSPWPWPYNFAQGPALLTLVLLLWAIRRNRPWSFAAAGVILGATFLSHTAPAAVIAIGTTLFCFWQAATRQWAWQQGLRNLLATGIPAFLISLPLLLPIFLRYRFHMLNPAPAQFSALYLGEAIRLLVTPMTLLGISALGGFAIATLSGRLRNAGVAFFLCVAISSAAMFVYGIGADILRGRGTATLPVLVPAFHFYLYVSLSCSIAFGIGAAWLLEKLPTRPGARAIISVVVIAGLIATAWPGYSRNLDTHKFVANAHDLAARKELKQLYDWCLEHSNADDVFLVDDFYGQYSVGAAGRKLIVLDPIFTSPYVDLAARSEDRHALYNAIRNGDEPTFTRLADQYRIRYVIATERAMLDGLYTNRLSDVSQVAIAQLQQVEDFGAVRIYQRDVP